MFSLVIGRAKVLPILEILGGVAAAGVIGSTWNNKDAKYAGNVLFSANKTIHKKILKLLKPALK